LRSLLCAGILGLRGALTINFLIQGKEPSNFLGLTLGFLDVESRVRAWIESLCVYGSLFRGQKLRDLKHKDSWEETKKN